MGATGIMPVGLFTRTYTSWRVLCQLGCLASRPARYNRGGQANIGLEMELQLVDTHGNPAHGMAQVILAELGKFDEHRIVAEIGDWVLELNLSVRQLIGTPLSDMYDEATELLNLIRGLACRHGVRVVLIGILPTAREHDIQLEHMAPVDRYQVINAALWRREGARRVKLHYPDGSPAMVQFDSIMGEVACTSVQPHFFFPDLDRVTQMHNIILATAGPLGALFGNAPRPFGANGWKDARTHLFTEATLGRCYVGGYISDPFATIRDAAQSRPLVRKPERPFSGRAQNLLLQVGTQWQMVDRIIPAPKDRRLRHEVRYCSSLPLLDVMSFMAILGGVLANPRSVRLARLIPEHVAKANYDLACRDGVQVQYLWPGADDIVRSTNLSTIIHELLSLAREGWELLGIDRTEVDRFLEPVQSRVGDSHVVVTGADWQVTRIQYYLDRRYEYWDAVARMIGDYAELCSRDDRSISTWPHPAANLADTRLSAAWAT